MKRHRTIGQCPGTHPHSLEVVTSFANYPIVKEIKEFMDQSKMQNFPDNLGQLKTLA